MRILIPLFILCITAFAEIPDEVIYIHPGHHSEFISPSTTILLRTHTFTDLEIEFSVYGEKSGMHDGQIVLSDNTVIFKPKTEFAEHEIVHVSVTSPRFSENASWQFTIGEHFEVVEPEPVLSKPEQVRSSGLRLINGVAVPSDFPEFAPEIYQPDKVAPGKIFITNWDGAPYFMIFENDGTPYFFQKIGSSHTRGFKLHPNGLLSRYSNDNGRCFYGMDSTYNIIKTFKPAHGYIMDEHEFQWLADGHYMFIAYGFHDEDMSKIVSGGHPSAQLKDCHIQEFDGNDNLVFEWLGFDYLDVTESIRLNLKNKSIDWMHSNSLAVDYDGHIILSIRHLSQVLKINRQTGDIIWRLGGRNNQFDFVNDEYMTSYQHDARPVPGEPNRYTIFDNGNYHSPAFSRAVEFELDTENMTATRVWEYRLPDGRTTWMGNAQRLPNGNTFINWADASVPKATEVTPDGEVVYQGDYVIGDHCYRTFRFDWESAVQMPYIHLELIGSSVGVICNKFGDKNVMEYEVWGGQSSANMSLLGKTDQTWILLDDFDNDVYYYFKVRAAYEDGSQSEFSKVEKIYISYIPAGINMLVNGDFSRGTTRWKLLENGGADASMSVQNSEMHVKINNGGSEIWSIQLAYNDLALIQDQPYRFEFDAYATSTKSVEAKLETNGTPYTNYGNIGYSSIGRQKKHYSYDFIMQDSTDPQARIVFNCGLTNSDLYIDNVSLMQVPTQIETPETLPTKFALQPNYPNPFNNSTTIAFELPQSGHVNVVIHDILGRQIVQLADQKMTAGIQELHWNGINASGLACASGLYFYTAQYKDVIQTQKIMLMK